MRVTHRSLLLVVAAMGVTALAGMVALWPDQRSAPPPAAEAAQTTELVNATLLEVTSLGDEADDQGLPPGATTVRITARIEASGEVVAFEMIDDTGETFAAGQRVRLAAISGEDGQTTYFVSDFRRGWPLAVLVALFLAAVLAFGRGQGARALLGLGLTFVAIAGFIVPAILDGRSPVSVALVGAALIVAVNLYLSHGLSPKTTAAVVGTAGALLVTALLAAAFVAAASITGFTSEEARLANYEVGGLSLRGLVLAGIIIGGLGVLDDVTMAQASTVFALRQANPRAGFGELLRGALGVGKDHVAATVNTLFLAYAGAALPLLILFTTGSDGLGTVLTSEVVAVEIVRTLVGSIGLIAAVPFTTALAAALALEEIRPRRRTPVPPPSSTSPGPASPADAEPDDGELWVQRLRSAYRLPGGK